MHLENYPSHNSPTDFTDEPISFVLVLLLFSNLWTPIRAKLMEIVSKVFPPIRFHRKDRDTLHWLGQALVGGVVVAVALYLLNWAFTYAGQILGQFIGPH